MKYVLTTVKKILNSTDKNLIVRVPEDNKQYSLVGVEHLILDNCFYATGATAFEKLTDSYLQNYLNLDNTVVMDYEEFLSRNKDRFAKAEQQRDNFEQEIRTYQKQIKHLEDLIYWAKAEQQEFVQSYLTR